MSDQPGARLRRLARRVLVVLLISTLQVALVLSIGGLVSTPIAAIALALTASMLIVLGWTGMRAHKRRDFTRRSVRAATATAVATVLALIVVLPVPAAQWTAPAGALHLADGTFLALRTAPAASASGSPTGRPLVAVHGGPGVPWTAREQRVLERLSSDREVIVYDQIGTGDSARLDDPDGYTFTRAVSDLEAVVASTGAERVTLLGYSWGAQLALSYAVRHPDRVDGLVLMSPGALPWDGVPLVPGSPQSRLDAGQRMALYGLALQPRNLFGYAMTLIDADLAHRFMPDHEADARYRELYLASSPGLVCEGDTVPDAPERLGHYANHGPGEQRGYASGVTASTIERLEEHPILIMRGECDYLDSGIAAEYLRELPQAKLLEFAGSGHALLEEHPDEMIMAIQRFLDGASPSAGIRGDSAAPRRSVSVGPTRMNW